MKREILLALALALFPMHALANDPHDPIAKAAETYKKEGADKFMPELLKGAAIESDKTVHTQGAGAIKQVEAVYGPFQGAEFIWDKPISKRITLVYYVLNYEKALSTELLPYIMQETSIS